MMLHAHCSSGRVVFKVSPLAVRVVRGAERIFHVGRELIIRSHERTPQVVDARHAVCMALRAHGWSYPRIGRVLGMDHASVIYAVRHWAAREHKRPQIAGKLRLLMSEVG